jgi:hypothetical protein
MPSRPARLSKRFNGDGLGKSQFLQVCRWQLPQFLPDLRSTFDENANPVYALGRPRCRTCPTRPTALYNPSMARYTLVYGVRLIPEGTLKGVEEATLKLADGSSAGLTLHTFDGTIPQLRRSLDRSLDAFFDLLPGAAEEDLEKFGD